MVYVKIVNRDLSGGGMSAGSFSPTAAGNRAYGYLYPPFVQLYPAIVQQ